jgi:hypothetical protein
MYHQSLAMEVQMSNKDNKMDDKTNISNSTTIRYLNYAPGPLYNTDMTKQLLDHDQLHEMVYPNEYVKVHDSAQKLVHIVLSSSYESGTHIDYYDDMKQ